MLITEKQNAKQHRSCVYRKVVEDFAVDKWLQYLCYITNYVTDLQKT